MKYKTIYLCRLPCGSILGQASTNSEAKKLFAESYSCSPRKIVIGLPSIFPNLQVCDVRNDLEDNIGDVLKLDLCTKEARISNLEISSKNPKGAEKQLTDLEKKIIKACKWKRDKKGFLDESISCRRKRVMNVMFREINCFSVDRLIDLLIAVVDLQDNNYDRSGDP